MGIGGGITPRTSGEVPDVLGEIPDVLGPILLPIPDVLGAISSEGTVRKNWIKKRY